MSYELTPDRVDEIQCDICGSRLKKLVEINGDKNKPLGESLVCCHCGHVTNFVKNLDAIPMYTAGQKIPVAGINIVCGLSDRARLKCQYKDCEIGWGEPEEDEPEPIKPEPNTATVSPLNTIPAEFTPKPKPAESYPVTTSWTPPTTNQIPAGKPDLWQRARIEKEIQSMAIAEAKPMHPYEMRDTHDDEVKVLQALQVNENEERERAIENEQLNRIDPQVNDFNPVMAGMSRVLTPKPAQKANDMKIGTVTIGPKI